MKALATALRRYPVLNAHFNPVSEELTVFKDINIGVAVNTEAGLMLPVIHNVENKTIRQIDTEMKDMVDSAKGRQISIQDLRGGTFSLTNFGPFGGLFASPMIYPPQVAIIGAGRIHQAPMVVERQRCVRPGCCRCRWRSITAWSTACRRRSSRLTSWNCCAVRKNCSCRCSAAVAQRPDHAQEPSAMAAPSSGVGFAVAVGAAIPPASHRLHRRGCAPVGAPGSARRRVDYRGLPDPRARPHRRPALGQRTAPKPAVQPAAVPRHRRRTAAAAAAGDRSGGGARN